MLEDDVHGFLLQLAKNPRRHTGDDCVGFDVACHERRCTDYRSGADDDAGKDDCPCADPCAVADPDGRSFDSRPSLLTRTDFMTGREEHRVRSDRNTVANVYMCTELERHTDAHDAMVADGESGGDLSFSEKAGHAGNGHAASHPRPSEPKNGRPQPSPDEVGEGRCEKASEQQPRAYFGELFADDLDRSTEGVHGRRSESKSFGSDTCGSHVTVDPQPRVDPGQPADAPVSW
jgi:hypothetical protein